jgi:Flp pilus assembly protein TadG
MTVHMLRRFGQPRTLANRRRGSTVVETALVLPILFYLAFGTVEFGHFFFVKHNFQSAAREGARAAVVTTATNADVTTAVTNAMNAAGIASNKYTVTLSPSNVSGVASGTSITITVSGTWGNVGVRPLGIIGSDKQVVGTTVMRRE